MRTLGSLLSAARYHLHEYESKTLLKRWAINTQPFVLLDEHMSRDEITSRITGFGLRYPRSELVVKAQILAGGRGKGRFPATNLQGGVRMASSVEEAIELVAGGMLGRRLVTAQTPADGVRVSQVMVAKAVTIVKEYYVAIVLDRRTQAPMLIVSKSGGVDIENIATAEPGSLHCFPLDINSASLPPTLLSEVGKLLSPDAQLASQLSSLFALFKAHDALQIEINPLALLSNGESLAWFITLVMAVDVKIECDDAAAFRQPPRSHTSACKREESARSLGVNFISLPDGGTIGCLVNGAGLAMATMDAVVQSGAMPANFLDIGGSATVEQVEGALRLILADPKIRALFVNVFGGIMRCDTIAEALVMACKAMDAPLPPIVVRLEGTRIDEARKLLRTSGLDLVLANDIAEGARLAAQAAATPAADAAASASQV